MDTDWAAIIFKMATANTGTLYGQAAGEDLIKIYSESVNLAGEAVSRSSGLTERAGAVGRGEPLNPGLHSALALARLKPPVPQ